MDYTTRVFIRLKLSRKKTVSKFFFHKLEFCIKLTNEILGFTIESLPFNIYPAPYNDTTVNHQFLLSRVTILVTRHYLRNYLKVLNYSKNHKVIEQCPHEVSTELVVIMISFA